MKKILYIVSTLKRTGPTSQLLNLIKNLDRSQFEPHVVTLSPEPFDSRWSEYEVLNVQLHSLRLSRYGGIFLAQSRLKRIVEQLQPDLIHSQGIRSDILSANQRKQVPRITTIRNFPQHDYLMTYGQLLSKLMLWKHAQAMHKLDVCFGVSKAVEANLATEFGLKNTSAILNGVDTEIYRSVDLVNKNLLRESIGLDVDSEIWISSGHLSERKDPLLLINSWKNTFGSDSSKILIFIGDGPQKNDCEKATVGCENIRIIGRVSNVSDYLKASDYFVSASKAEGLPNAVLEAMACGLPVLLSDIGPHREIWQMDPNIGQLFKLGSKRSLISSFVDMAKYDRDSHSQSALTLVEKSFSALVMSKNYQHSYSELIEGFSR